MGANDQALVVVGIDGTPAADAAIRYAARGPTGCGAGAPVVHVARTSPTTPCCR